MNVQDVGQASLHGWKKKLADATARKAPVRDDYVRTALGLLFLALSVRHVAATARALASRR